MPHFNWRVYRADQWFITIELSRDSDPQEPPPESLETVSAIPSQAAEPESR